MDPAGWHSSLFLLLSLRQTDVGTDTDRTGGQGVQVGGGGGSGEGGGNGFGVSMFSEESDDQEGGIVVSKPQLRASDRMG